MALASDHRRGEGILPQGNGSRLQRRERGLTQLAASKPCRAHSPRHGAQALHRQTGQRVHEEALLLLGRLLALEHACGVTDARRLPGDRLGLAAGRSDVGGDVSRLDGLALLGDRRIGPLLCRRCR